MASNFPAMDEFRLHMHADVVTVPPRSIALWYHIHKYKRRINLVPSTEKKKENESGYKKISQLEMCALTAPASLIVVLTRVLRYKVSLSYITFKHDNNAPNMS
jgi:hypothetical protein